MDSAFKLMLLIGGFLLFVKLLSYLNSEKKKPSSFNFYFWKDEFLTVNEANFFKVLTTVVDGKYLVFPQVSLQALVDVKKIGKSNQQFGARQQINKKIMDYVLCDKETLKPICVIELNDRSHIRPDRVKRDDFLRRLFSDISMPFIEVKAKRDYSPHYVLSCISDIVECPAQDASSVDDTAETITEICPLCGGVMEKKFAAGNTKPLFWGCVNYPECKGMIFID